MNYYHHMSEMLELTDDGFIMIDTGSSWETDTTPTGKGTEYTKEILLTTPNEHKEQLITHLEKQGYKVTKELWNMRKHDERLTVAIKTKQGKNKEQLVTKLCDSVISHFENCRLL